MTKITQTSQQPQNKPSNRLFEKIAEKTLLGQILRSQGSYLNQRLNRTISVKSDDSVGTANLFSHQPTA